MIINFLNNKITRIILLTFVILIGIALRFYQLGNNPPSLDWDEASMGYNAYSILKTGADEYSNKLPLSIRSFDDYKPALYTYLIIPAIWSFGLNEFSVRLPAAMIGSLSIIVFYFLLKQIFTNWEKSKQAFIALLGSFFLAISPWHLQFSRAAFEGQIGFFFLISGLLFFFKSLRNGKFFYVSMILFLLCLYSYHSFRLLIPLLIFSFLIIFWKKILNFKKHAIVSLIILFVLSLPIWTSFVKTTAGTGARLSMVTVFSDPSIIDQSIERINFDRKNNDVIGTIFHNRRIVYFLAITKGYLDHFNPDFLFIHGDGGVQHHAVDMGMLYLWDLPFILIGIYYLFKKIDRRIFVLIILFLLSPLPASITTGTPHPVRGINMILGFYIFCSVGLMFVFEKIIFLKKKIIKSILFLVIAISLVFNVCYYLHQYYVHTPIEYGYFWQYGYKEALNFAKNNESKVDGIVMTYEYDQPYIYYLFYNKIDPIWYQSNWNYNGNGAVDRFKRIIGKYTFRNVNYLEDARNKNKLLIGTPKEIPDNAKIIKTINFPDGREAFRIVKT